jgi:hypothetical protein
MATGLSGYDYDLSAPMLTRSLSLPVLTSFRYIHGNQSR